MLDGGGRKGRSQVLNTRTHLAEECGFKKSKGEERKHRGGERLMPSHIDDKNKTKQKRDMERLLPLL